MSKTINQALKELYLSLGGDPSALEDNSTVSDYIADLENGLKSLAELPAPSSDNSGKIAKVVSDGEGGYIWGAENETSDTLYAVFGYDTTASAYGYYGHLGGNTTSKKTWQEFIADAEGKKNIVAYVSTKDDPNFTDVFNGGYPTFRLDPADFSSVIGGDSWGAYGSWTGSKNLALKSDMTNYRVFGDFSISVNEWSSYVSMSFGLVEYKTPAQN